MLNEYVKDFLNELPENVHVLPIGGENIVVEPELRKSCEMNHCGEYGKNWMCPPGVGEVEDLIDELRSCKGGLIIQTIHQLEDSFDFDGMTAGVDKHSKYFNELLDSVCNHADRKTLLPLNAGACKVCPSCSYVDNAPCRYPERAIASLESYCVDVNNTLMNVGLKYNNGENTVSYVGMILERQRTSV